MDLDPQGILIIIIQIAAFLLLLIGVYPSKAREKAENLVKHGFLSTIALAMNLITVFVVMIPVFLKILGGASTYVPVFFPLLLGHVIIGAVTLGSSILMVVSWFLEPLTELGCARKWRLMKPTLIIWGVSLIIGIAVHIFGLL